VPYRQRSSRYVDDQGNPRRDTQLASDPAAMLRRQRRNRYINDCSLLGHPISTALVHELADTPW
jgi:hypothetical protein